MISCAQEKTQSSMGNVNKRFKRSEKFLQAAKLYVTSQ